MNLSSFVENKQYLPEELFTLWKKKNHKKRLFYLSSINYIWESHWFREEIQNTNSSVLSIPLIKDPNKNRFDSLIEELTIGPFQFYRGIFQTALSDIYNIKSEFRQIEFSKIKNIGPFVKSQIIEKIDKVWVIDMFYN
jgi:hypothetical protein